MTKTTTFTYLLLLISLIVIIVFVNKTYNLESKIENLNKEIVKFSNCDKSTIDELKHQQFKEDTYIRQQEREVNLILAIIPIFFGLVGFFIFQAQKEVLAVFISSIEKKNHDYDTKNESVHNKLLKLQMEIYYQSAIMNLNRAKFDLEKGNTKEYTIRTFLALENIADYCLEVQKEKNQKELEVSMDTITHLLSELDKSNIIHMEWKSHIYAIIQKTRQINSQKISGLLSKIETKIKYE